MLTVSHIFICYWIQTELGKNSKVENLVARVDFQNGGWGRGCKVDNKVRVRYEMTDGASLAIIIPYLSSVSGIISVSLKKKKQEILTDLQC